jgi:hypothetical protein
MPAPGITADPARHPAGENPWAGVQKIRCRLRHRRDPEDAFDATDPDVIACSPPPRPELWWIVLTSVTTASTPLNKPELTRDICHALGGTCAAASNVAYVWDRLRECTAIVIGSVLALLRCSRSDASRPTRALRDQTTLPNAP